MIKRIVIKASILLIVLSPVVSNAADYLSNGFSIGVIEFTGKNGVEGIVILNKPDKVYLLNKGMVLIVRRGSVNVSVKITDIDGKYLRCTVINENTGAGLMAGDEVYYSDELNTVVKYREVKSILGRLIRLYEDFIYNIESTEDKSVITDQINKFSADLDLLIPEMKRVNSRYPELKDFFNKPPAELRNESEVLQLLEPRLRDAFYKIRMYNTDPDVKKAVENLQKVLQKMDLKK